MRYALKLRQFPTHPAYPYVFAQDTLSFFLSRPRKYIPFCLRMQDLFARSRISLRDVMCVDTSSSPPWQSVTPHINPISGRLLATPISGKGGCLGPPLMSPVLTGRFLKFKRHSFRLNMIYISKKRNSKNS